MRPARDPRLARWQPAFVYHSSFDLLEAPVLYGGVPDDLHDGSDQPFLSNEQTCACARRMHFAAYRLSLAQHAEQRRIWKRCYLAWRDRIVLGNIKLVYRAV